MSIVLEQNTWRMSSTYFVFIVTSRNLPIYEQFDSMRRLQMNSLGIPHKFLINGILPVGYTLQSDEEYFEDASFNPGMFMKFYNALCKFGPLPNYIVRLNSSTFVNFEKLTELFNGGYFPSKRLFGGHNIEFSSSDESEPFYMFAGTAMVFSCDVAEYLRNINMESESIRECISTCPDDFAISQILQELGNYPLFDISSFFIFCEDDKTWEDSDEVIFYRIKNTDRILTDINIWKQLLLTYPV
jgi:hypothetical protein